MNSHPLRLLSALAIAGCILAAATEAGQSPNNVPAPGSTRAPRYIIGLSPFLEDKLKDDVYRRIVGFLLEEVPLGGSLYLYDAYHVRTIAQVDVPNVRAFQSAKTRANQFKEPIRKLKEFLAAQHEKPATNGMKLDQAVRFPQFIDFISENLAGQGRAAVVAVLGSPLYLDHKEPGFSMFEGYFPSDAHLTASREKSVYGVKDHPASLDGVVVHFGYFGDPWVSELHQEKIARFWTLYLKQQGARLATFCGDLPTVFNALGGGSEAADNRFQAQQIDRSQSKIEMLRITRDVGIADWITRDVLPNISQRPPTILVGPMKIGIRWQGNLDLDLYSTPKPNAETLYFEHTRSSEGYYFKDHRSSPEREYEFIEFERPVNVWEVEAMINFYKGRSPGGVAGEIRIEFDGRIYSGRFSLAASHGNEGRSGDSQQEFWTRIDIPKLLKLSENGRNSAARR